MRRSKAEIIREYGPFPGADNVGGVTYDGKQPYAEARAATLDDIARVLDDYSNAARNAIRAGFDGVQLHAANGYLIDQFLRDNSNFRDDDYVITLHGVGTATNAKAEVYHLRRAKDIAGEFTPSTDVKGELRNAAGVMLRFDPPLELDSDDLRIELSHRITPKISGGHRESGVE